jgi:uncharacterized protein YraI
MSRSAPIVGRIPPDARGILVEKEDGVFMEGYFEGTGWMQIVWGDMVGWANGRYLQAVLGEPKR